ncbi:hypothetical protein BJ971_007859 [Actinoplanes digitatis]|uniref:Uncharacterized protein n=1 Tax=Actinoplanes digitatis TaxID=1868 RepID=A0A7W7MUB7_9ACTN|nr:hypothetical protein [Actinoplanes digitatis]
MALGGLLLGAALLTTGTANADQVEGGGWQVVFGGGGVLGISCQSTPSVESMIVPAEGTVRVVNRTGHGAKLLLNGAPSGPVPENGATEVVFRRGTTAVTLDPDCALNDQATPVLVTASPSQAAKPDPIPAPIGSETSESPSAPSRTGTPAAADGNSSLPDSVTSASRPQRQSTTRADRPAEDRHSASRADGAAQAAPQDAAAAKTKDKADRNGTAGAVAAPTSSGMPPGGEEATSRGVPALDSASPEYQSGQALDLPPAYAVAAEPVATVRPMWPSRQIGLLAVIATVCVAGVAAGAIRAIVSQRASRASVA